MAAYATNRIPFSPLPNPDTPRSHPFAAIKIPSLPLRPPRFINLSRSLFVSNAINNDSGGPGGRGGHGGDGRGGGSGGDGEGRSGGYNPIVLLIEGWRLRVAADPEFPFKVLMEELVGVSATAAGDMACRPNFGLGELDFVLSTIIVGSIVNFTLMYLLAPTTAAASAMSTSALPSYIFEPGPYSLGSRAATFVYKGVLFAAVGFASGLAGTAIANGLVAFRERGNGAASKTKKKGPKTVLNAATWAVHMGLSSNVRYQTLNAVEFGLAKALSPAAFKGLVVVLRCLNNMVGGMSFVALGKLMGSQKADQEEEAAEEQQVGLKVE